MNHTLENTFIYAEKLQKMLIIFFATTRSTKLAGIFLGRKLVYDCIFAENTFRGENTRMLRFYFDEREHGSGHASVFLSTTTYEVEGYRMTSVREPLLHSITAFPAMIAQSHFLLLRELRARDRLLEISSARNRRWKRRMG